MPDVISSDINLLHRMHSSIEINSGQSNQQQVEDTSELDKFIQSLSKSPESRSHKDMAIIIDYALKNKGLSLLAEQLSVKFIKALLAKHANAVCVGPRSVIAEQGHKIYNFHVVLSGRVVRNKTKINKKQNEGQQNVFQKLGVIAHDEMKQIVRLKNRKIVRKMSYIQNHTFRKVSQDENFSNMHEIQLIGVEDRSTGIKYTSDIFTVEKSILLEISMPGFLSCLSQFYQEKISNLYDIVKHYPCFVGVEKEIIEKFIVSLSERKQKRGSFIYRQNEPIRCIYLLTNGQIKLTKQSNLFVQDPNNLYANRINLILGGKSQKAKARYQIKQQQMKKMEATLPYADLSLMFNYLPKKKTIELSRLHSFCFFGGQQLIESKKRETNAICNSLQVIYYQIQITKIQEIIGTKNMPAFIKGLKMQAKEKVLRRQSQFANTIHLENQNNMNYFYYEGEEQKKVHHRHRVLKLNSKIDEKSSPKMKHKSMDQKFPIAPRFTAFNFHKLGSLTPIRSQHSQFALTHSQNNKQQHSEIPNPEAHNQANESEDQNQQTQMPNQEEMKIMNITHTWKLIKKKVDVQMVKSQKLSPKKYTIDVNEPLIDNKFFTNLDREKRRVQRQIRKDKITLGQSRASTFGVRMTLNV